MKRNVTSLVVSIFSLLLVLLFGPVLIQAQQNTGSISGIVKDSSGAVLPEATITATNVNTGGKDTVVSDSSGAYTFVGLSAGVYKLDVAKTGFAPTALTDITLQIYQRAVIDVVMKVGQANETITVTGATPLVDSSTASLGTVVNEQAIEDLPLNLREVGALALTVPGTIETTSRSLTSSAGNGSGFNDSSYAGAGGYSGGNLLLIDGMVSRALNNGAFALNPPPDLVKEFKIQDNVYDASFGLTSGTVLNLVTKSGSNQIHGGLWEFLRNRSFDARNFFDTKAVTANKPEFTRNQFGGNLGGPIIRNKLFFFLGYEGLRLAQANNSSSPVPSPAQKQGDFSGLLTGTSQNLCGAGGPANLNYDTGQLFDPATESNFTCPNSGNVILVGNPIPGNNIAAYRGGVGNIDPVAQRVLALFPDPNSGQFFVNETVRRDTRNQYDARLDWNVGPKDILFGRYLLGTASQIFPGPFNPFNQIQSFRGHNGVVGWTHTFGQSTVNEFRFGYQQDYLRFTCQGCPRAPGTLGGFGISGLAASNPSLELYPNVTFTNYATFGDGLPGFYPDVLPDSLYRVGDTFTKIIGKHNLSFGADLNFWRTKGVEDPAQANGVINFNGQFSDLAGESSAAASGADAADLELGFPSGGCYTRSPFLTNLVGGNWLGLFVQDNYRVSPNLTVEAGIRWDYRRQPVEENNKLVAFLPISHTFQPGDALLITALPDAQNDALCSQAYLQSATGACLVATAAQRRQLGFNSNQVRQVSYGPGYGNFSPRLGISFRPTKSDKLVLHAGGGIFRDLPLTNQLGATDDNNPVFTQNPTYNTATGAPPPLTNGTPTRTQQIFVGAVNPTLAQVTSQVAPSPFYRTPTVYEWSTSVQTQLSTDWAVEADYIGNRGVHEDFLHGDFNQAVPGIGPLQARRPYPDFNLLRFDTSDAFSNYNALLVKVTKRTSYGLSALVSYTYSKALDDNSGTSETEQAPQNDNNPRADYAVADTSLRHRLVVSGVYQLPFGEGKRFASSKSALNRIIGDWVVSFIVSAQSGYPFTVTSATDFSNTGSFSARPDRTCSGSGPRTLTEFFNLNCFSTASLQQALANGTPRFGTSGRNILTGPRLADVDTSLIKRFNIAEGVKTEFRADVFNLFNHPNFGLPNAIIGSSSTGIISNTVPLGSIGYNRDIQLSLRILF